MIRIIQLTDLHLDVEGSKPHDQDTDERFNKIVNELGSIDFDFLVVTGDICAFDGENEVYERVKAKLDSLNKPYYVLPGNHDDQEKMVEVFGQQGSMKTHEFSFKVEEQGRSFYFLDTALGLLSDVSLMQFELWLQQEPRDEVIVFMHHPPLEANVPHMDNNHCLQNYEDFLNVVSGSDKKVYVFCGHYHVQKTISVKNLTVSIAPSPYFHMNPFNKEFESENTLTCYQRILIHDYLIDFSTRYFND